ncbi:hypothetical protein BDK51DRAFT_45945 [Blyttiomyces helicus]|uniref:Uncharacterized protein n=1 Tax=Blyttiomyces helicus TaxID=388810 RepID=A0A4V1IPP6_9FUNG|nr:hypothetical protein BDK51DRAFT_45945 [Blyttiomyces helicus]|eukprot:RKO83787.1 hypothetical protein BDK51DRAFT_45945 [Blyttiomyces helicus]
MEPGQSSGSAQGGKRLRGDDTDGEEWASEIPTRKVGRPRKNQATRSPPPMPSSSRGQSSSSARPAKRVKSEPAASDRPSDAERAQSLPPKRKVCRPRKNPPAPMLSSPHAQSPRVKAEARESDSVAGSARRRDGTDGDERGSSAAPKRKVGRPREDLRSPAPMASSPASVRVKSEPGQSSGSTLRDADGRERELTVLVTPAKRKVGRPRENIATTSPAPSQSSVRVKSEPRAAAGSARREMGDADRGERVPAISMTSSTRQVSRPSNNLATSSPAPSESQSSGSDRSEQRDDADSEEGGSPAPMPAPPPPRPVPVASHRLSRPPTRDRPRWESVDEAVMGFLAGIDGGPELDLGLF